MSDPAEKSTAPEASSADRKVIRRVQGAFGTLRWIGRSPDHLPMPSKSEVDLLGREFKTIGHFRQRLLTVIRHHPEALTGAIERGEISGAIFLEHVLRIGKADYLNELRSTEAGAALVATAEASAKTVSATAPLPPMQIGLGWQAPLPGAAMPGAL